MYKYLAALEKALSQNSK